MGFNVTIGNAQLGLCNKISQKIKIYFRNYEVEDKVFIFPLGGVPHMVLSVSWFSSLGDYVINYQKLELIFKLNDQEIVLQVIKDHMREDACKLLESYKHMEKIIHQGDTLKVVFVRKILLLRRLK